MLKKLALPVVALAVMLILSSAPAKAAVQFGITVGPSPVYTYPAYPYYYDPYVDPYAYSYVAPYYYAPAPVYTYPSLGFGFGFGGHHDRDHDRGRFEHRGNDFRGHDNHSRGFNSGGHRR
jgi:hypothetical protein